MRKPLRLGSIIRSAATWAQNDAVKPASCRRRPEAFLLSVRERQAGVA